MDIPFPEDRRIDDLIRLALQEDLPDEDVTTSALISDHITTQAVIIAKESGTVAGAAIVRLVYAQVDPAIIVTLHVGDGSKAQAGDLVIRLNGNARSILKGERVALNFLQHLSGIATLTAEYSKATEEYPVTILDTRKTTPGLRSLEKWAVQIGGGVNHRMSLSDGVLIKDTHLSLLQREGKDVEEACRLAKTGISAGWPVRVEVESLDQIPLALNGGADIILLDNMVLADIKNAVGLIQGRARTEVSGGVNLKNIREIAATGVDFVSIGALTHSAPAFDFSLKIN